MPELLHVGLQAPAALLPELAAFYGERLGLPGCTTATARRGGRGGGDDAGASRPPQGAPFYHFALLVPGDRFEAALAWCRERVELLPDRETGDPVFDFTNWEAQALYFHDPAGSIVELIAHRGIGEAGATGPFSPDELLGVSEVGIVCDPPSLAAGAGARARARGVGRDGRGRGAPRVRGREGADADPLPGGAAVAADRDVRRRRGRWRSCSRGSRTGAVELEEGGSVGRGGTPATG